MLITQIFAGRAKKKKQQLKLQGCVYTFCRKVIRSYIRKCIFIFALFAHKLKLRDNPFKSTNLEINKQQKWIKHLVSDL